MAGLGRRPRRARSARALRRRSGRGDQRQGIARRTHSHRGLAAILARRLIPCLDVRDGQVVKGVKFRDHRVVGDILELAARYRDAGADELVFYDISASPQGRSVDRSWVSRVARTLDIPFCVAGGIRSVTQAEEVLASGAEKISVNSPALADPDLIDALSQRFGAQCVVVGVDSQTVGPSYRVQQFTGDVERSGAARARSCSIACRATVCARASTSPSCAQYARCAACRWSPRAAPAPWNILPKFSGRPEWMRRSLPAYFIRA